MMDGINAISKEKMAPKSISLSDEFIIQKVKEDGTVEYNDVNRYHGVNIENPNVSYRQ